MKSEARSYLIAFDIDRCRSLSAVVAHDRSSYDNQKSFKATCVVSQLPDSFQQHHPS